MKMLLAGQWVERDNCIEVRNPFDDSLIDTVPQAHPSDIKESVISAEKGFELMRKMPSHQRAAVLEKTSRLIESRSEDFAETLSKEVGKTIREARGEAARAVQTFLCASEEAKRIQGQTVPFDAVAAGEGRKGFYSRVPAGIVLAITPFNFPLNLAAHKVAPAIAAGNSVILKPASYTPLCDLMLGEVLLEAGLPEHCLNIITGSGSSIGNLLVGDNRIRVVTFTGSVEIGRKITEKAGLKKIAMELGSNSAVILMDDADLDSAIPRIMTGAYAVAGQVCISVQRIIVHEKIYGEFLDRFHLALGELKVGNPLEEDTDIGPMISTSAADRVESWVKEAISEGAECTPSLTRKGTLLSPVALTNVSVDMKVFSEEAFGPLVTINSFKELPEAIRLANTSRFGLQAGIYTQDISNAFTAIEGLDVGGVIINDVPAYRVDLMPYGGMKESGLGREGLKYTIEEMTEIKLVCFKL